MTGVNMMHGITPTEDPTLERRFADFPTLVDALEYAAKGLRGANFYNGRAELVSSATWSEIRDGAEAIGRRLISIGFAPGDRIALIAETTVEFITFFLGTQYASVLPVPLPLPTSFGGKKGYVTQLKGQLESCAASGVLTPDFMNELVSDAVKDLPMLKVGSFKDFMACDASDKLALPKPNDLAYLQYSSGSTRFPHGVSVTHKSLMSNTRGMAVDGVHIEEGDRCVSWLPFYHDMGLVGTFLTTVCSQLSVDFIPPEEFARRPLCWLRVVSQNRGTVTYSPTFGFDVCSRRASNKVSALDGLDLSCIRVAGIGGDMIRPEVMHAFTETFKSVGFKAISLLPSYGLAECTLAVSFARVNTGIEVIEVEENILAGDRHILLNSKVQNTRLREVVNCGRPLPEYEVEIRGEDNIPLSEGIVGNVFVRGPSVMREYFNDPDTTRSVLSADGWLNTGDMGFFKSGDIFIVGRAKDMIIVNGRNHWPQDIEWAAEQLPDIKNGDVAAISIPGESSEEVPMILAQCRYRDAADRIRFIDLIKKHIHRETGITCLVQLVPPRSLPRTSSGKLSRSKARNQYLSGHLEALAS